MLTTNDYMILTFKLEQLQQRKKLLHILLMSFFLFGSIWVAMTGLFLIGFTNEIIKGVIPLFSLTGFLVLAGWVSIAILIFYMVFIFPKRLAAWIGVACDNCGHVIDVESALATGGCMNCKREIKIERREPNNIR